MASSSSSSSSSPPVLITLQSNDGEEFVVEEAVAVQSQTIRNFVEDGCSASDRKIPVSNVDGSTLAKVVEYCKKHAASPDGSDGGRGDSSDLKSWDAEFMKQADDFGTLFSLILAANYLDVKGLLDLGCQTVADRIKDKLPEEIRKIFHIENDFTEEEEEQVRKENQWAFE